MLQKFLFGSNGTACSVFHVTLHDVLLLPLEKGEKLPCALFGDGTLVVLK